MATPVTSGRSDTPPDRIGFQDVEEAGILRRFVTNLQTLTGLPFDFVDTTGRHSRQLHTSPTPLCQLVHSTAKGHEACEDCTLRAVRECLASQKPVIQECHLGLHDVYYPFLIRGKVVGILTTGQLLFTRPTEGDFRRVRAQLKALALPTKEARKLFFSLPVYPQQKLEAIFGLLSVMTEYVADAEERLWALREVKREDRLQRARRFIESRYQEKLTLKDVAAATHTSVSRLSHLFQERLQTTFVSYLNEFRLDKAGYLLANSDLPITEVAGQSGFTSISHFNHQFKKQFGLTPRQYRNSKKQQ